MASKLLLNEYPLLVLPELATAIGLNEAIILQQIHYWMGINKRAGKSRTHYHQSRWWTYNSVSKWCGQFPFWSYETIKRTLMSLRKPYTQKAGRRRAARGALLITGNYNAAGFDKTIWYTIDYDELNRVVLSLGQNDLTRGQNDLMDQVKMNQPIPETTIHDDDGNDNPDETFAEILRVFREEIGETTPGTIRSLDALYKKYPDLSRWYAAFGGVIGSGVRRLDYLSTCLANVGKVHVKKPK